jgi:hypothetical protein
LTTVGEFKPIGISALTANVLCQRHNQALSGLDALAGRFFEFMRDESPHRPLTLINGDELERWMLKLMCAFISRGTSFGEERLRDWCPPVEWLRILFGSNRVLPTCGLCYVSAGQQIWRKTDVEITAARQPASGAIEIAVVVAGFPFLFAMQPRPTIVNSPEMRIELVHRPRAIRIENAQGQRRLEFGWLAGWEITATALPTGPATPN